MADTAVGSQGLDNEALIERLQRGAFGYFERYTNPENGLVADATQASSPCSIAAVGFGLTAWPVAVERGWRSREDALAYSLATVRFFDNEHMSKHADAISHRGFFLHFLDMKTGRRAWNSEISSIDTAILLAGMLAAASYFEHDTADERELRERVAAIADRIDWAWMCDRGHQLRQGWKPGQGFLPWHWTGYSEALLMLLIGMGSGARPVAPDILARWLGTLQWSGDAETGYIFAGPLFIHLYPQVWLDLRGAAVPGRSIDWFENTRRAIAEQRAYASRNPNGFSGYGEDVWGLSACPGPQKRATLRNGQRVWIPGYAARAVPHGPDDGTLVPWGPLACIPFAPEDALRGTRRILADYPEVLRDGMFVDAFNPSVRARTPAGWVAARSTGIDQGLLVAMIENNRSGLIWRLMTKSPVVSRGLIAMRLMPQPIPSAAL